MKKKETNVEGGSPAATGPHDESRQNDDSKKPSKVIKQEAVKKSELGNMTAKKGYNETPSTVPVKPAK